jgi:general secretion pathway protein J
MRQNGFTLLEMLVASAIFAVLSVMAYSGLQTVLNVRDETQKQSERLAGLQVMLGLMQMDFVQAIDRPVRDGNGVTVPALVGDGDIGSLEFTRGGVSNPLQLPRSQLQRVAYGLKDGGLVRDTWQVLDRAQDSVSRQTLFLPGVVDWELRFLDRQREWHEDWSSITSGVVQPPPTALPLAVEVTLELEEWGRVRRLFRLPEAAS